MRPLARVGAALALLATIVLAGCSVGSSSTSGRTGAPAGAPAAEATDDTASHTPTELRHPCDLVPARTASRALGARVTARVVDSKAAVRTLDCSYAPAGRDADAPVLEIRSTPDPTGLDALVGLYLGVDRLQHHPVHVAGADDGEVVLQPEDGLLTVFVKQGFVTHTVVAGLGDLARAERVALRLAALVVAGNRSDR